MQLEKILLLLTEALLVFELLAVAINPLPNTPEKWRAKKEMVLRRFCYYAACVVVAASFYVL